MNEDLITRVSTSIFERLGGDFIDPPAILPASVPLELSGEAVQSRLCLFGDVQGREYVLRPDLTLAVARQEADARADGTSSGETVHRYAARAYRLPAIASAPMEFTQVGFERFGGAMSAQADADAFAIVHQAATANAVAIDRIYMGDLSVFPAFVDALNIAPITAGLIKRAFRQAGGVRTMLDETPMPPAADLMAALNGKTGDDAEAAFLGYLAANDIPMIGTRTIAEIIDGLHASQAAADAGGVPAEAQAVLKQVLAVDAPITEAADTLRAIADKASLAGLGDTLDSLAKRHDLIAASINADSARFGTPFGRRFTYYDGFVFELFGKGSSDHEPLAGGGRYDGLIAGLSIGAASATGIGGVVRPDRIAAALEAQGQ